MSKDPLALSLYHLGMTLAQQEPKRVRCPGVSLRLPSFRSDLCQDRAAYYRGAAREDANPGGDLLVDLWNASAWRKHVKVTSFSGSDRLNIIEHNFCINKPLPTHQNYRIPCGCSLVSPVEEFDEERGFLPWREQRITLSYGVFFDGLLRPGKIWHEHGKTSNIKISQQYLLTLVYVDSVFSCGGKFGLSMLFICSLTDCKLPHAIAGDW